VLSAVLRGLSVWGGLVRFGVMGSGNREEVGGGGWVCVFVLALGFGCKKGR